jgi:hypothetical protein
MQKGRECTDATTSTVGGAGGKAAVQSPPGEKIRKNK